MKFVFSISRLGFGGAERVVSVLANEFAKDNDVKIILTSGDNPIAYKIDDRVQIDTIPSSYGNLRRWLAFRKKCVEYRADAVLAFMEATGIMSSISLIFTKIPVIASERNDPSEKSRRLSTPLRILGKLSNYLTSWYVFQSEGARSYYPKIAQKKSSVILNPLNTDELPKRDENSIEKKVVNVGRLHPQKNQMLLIEAFGESEYAKEHTLYVYGEGDFRLQLQAKINDLNLNEKVVLAGNCTDVHEEIKNSALFVFTSDYEGLPNALIEAMAMGIPCISTDCSPGGARMLIETDHNGILVPCRDKDALVKAMNKMYADNNFAQKCGQNAIKIKNAVEQKTIAKEWIECINQLI